MWVGGGGHTFLTVDRLCPQLVAGMMHMVVQGSSRSVCDQDRTPLSMSNFEAVVIGGHCSGLVPHTGL